MSDHSVGMTGSGASEPPAPTDLTGTVVAGKYELVRLLGQGGMGAVYEARNRATLKRVAVKLLFEDLGANEQVVKRFFREAQASSVIESDYIVQVYDSGRDERTGHPYMVMEMLQGEDLEGAVERLGPMHPICIAKILLQVTMGLAKAHERGIVHRDIKPANIFLTTREDGDVIAKLLDFGVAKVKMDQFSDTTSAGLTATGSILGTPVYMSPEQARGLSTVDARSDVWSLGVVMYEMLTGSIPYGDAKTLGDLMVAIITADLPLLQDRAPWAPPELAEIVHRAMSRDLDKRFANAAEMRDALLEVVPDGPRLSQTQLSAIDPEFRATVAPKLQLSDGMLKAVNKTGLSMAHSRVDDARPAQRQGKGTILVATVAGIALLGGGALGVWRVLGSTEPPPAEAASPSPGPPTEATTEGAADSQPKTFYLVVLPADAQVEVGGKPVENNNGTVKLSGRAGTTQTVRVLKGDQKTDTVVAITENGLLPPKIQLADKPEVEAPAQSAALPAPPPATAVGRAPRPKARSARTTKPAPAKPKSKTKPDNSLATDTSEFQ